MGVANSGSVGRGKSVLPYGQTGKGTLRYGASKAPSDGRHQTGLIQTGLIVRDKECSLDDSAALAAACVDTQPAL